MISPAASEGTMPRSTRVSHLAGLLFYAIAAARKLTYCANEPSFSVVVALLGAILVLYLLHPQLTRRFPSTHVPVVLLQMALIQSLGLVRPHEDVWALLYLPLSLQVWQHGPARFAHICMGLFAASLLGTLLYTLGPLAAVGQTATLLVAGAFFISFNAAYAQAERTRLETQRLLSALQASYRELQSYARQVEELASERERDHLARELHDAVGQLMTTITQAAQAARMLVDQAPEQIPEHLDRLQQLTSAALAQMRSLIKEWRLV